MQQSLQRYVGEFPARQSGGFALLGILLFFCCAFPVFAEALGWTAKARAEASLESGNVEAVSSSLSGSVVYRDTVPECRMYTRHSYGEQDGLKVENYHMLLLALDLWYNDTWSPFVFGQVEYSFKRRIDFRRLLGIGAKYTFLHSDSGQHELSVSAAILYDVTDYAPAAAQAPNESLRYSLRLKGEHVLIDDRLELTHTSFFAPAFTLLRDYRLSTEIALKFPLSDELKFMLSFIDEYENIVAEGLERNDAALKFGLELAME